MTLSNNKIKSLCIVFLCSTFSLALSACQGDTNVHSSNTAQEAPIQPPKPEIPQEPVTNEKEGYEGVDKVIGQSLTDYSDGMPVGYEIAHKRFNEMSESSTNRIEKLPLYSVEYDTQKLEKALLFFEEKYGAFKKPVGSSKSSGQASLKSDPNVLLLLNGRRQLRIRQATATLEFYDSTPYSSDYYDVKEENLNYQRLLASAQSDFEQFFAKPVLDYSFFYRFDLLMNSVAQGSKEPVDTVGGVNLMLKHTIGKIPLLGSGAPAMLTYLPNGQLIGAYNQFVQFKKKENPVTLFSSEQALNRLENLMHQDGISLDDHHIKESLFGYMLPAEDVPVKWLVPAYSFSIVPNNGIMDKGRVYSFSASDDQSAIEAYEANMRLIKETYDRLYDFENTKSDKEQKKEPNMTYLLG